MKPTKLTTRWLFYSRTNASVNSVTPLDNRGDRLYITHCPGGVSGLLKPNIGQFREFDSSRVRTRIVFRGTFSCALIDLRKARERALPGGRLGTTPVTTACMPRSWKVEEWQKKKISLEKMINQQSAARSTSNTKHHKLICQLRTNTIACTWPANDHSNGVRDHSNNKAHRLYFSKESFWG